MPNRIIKETITTSCEIDNLSAEEERFFYRLMVVCDDFGRIDARPEVLRAKCFPLKVDDIKSNDVKKWLKKLVEIGLITLYKAENKPYLYMTKWEKHQQKRAKHSKYPAPDDGVISDDINSNQLQEDVPENRESRTENTRNDDIENLFKSLWQLYPNKKGKAQVKPKKKKELYSLGYDVLKTCIDRYISDKKDWQEWQHGSTFFNGGYIDYLDENYNDSSPQQNTPLSDRRFAD